MSEWWKEGVTISQGPQGWLEIACFEWPTVENLNIFNWLSEKKEDDGEKQQIHRFKKQEGVNVMLSWKT